MKLNVVTYLIKEGVSENDALDQDKIPKKITFNVKGVTYSLFLKKSNSKPRWSEIFTGIGGVNSNFFITESIKGVLLINIDDRLVAFTFGHGRSMIKSCMIERGFGLRVTLNLSDAEQIKSIDKSTLEKVSLNTRSQTSKNTNVDDFDFEFDQEILKSLCAVVDNQDGCGDNEYISGCDSLSIYTNIELDIFPDLARRFLVAYKSEKYKEKYPWVDFIQLVTDPMLLDVLNEKMVEMINNEEFDKLWISPPEIINYNDFSGFVYKVKARQSPCFHSELSMAMYIAESKIKKPVTVDLLKRKEIRIYNASELDIDGWTIFNCINSELICNDELYILNDGRWYRIEKDFSESVNLFFNQLNYCNIMFPPYNGKNEGEYLRSIADGERFALLDQQWITPKGTASRLEFCDLLSECNAFIHVKKYGSSSVLSHLFSQASVSIDLLMNDVSIQDQVNKYLDETYLSLRFKKDEIPRKYRVVLAIMQKTPGDLHLPFFSKVNLRHHARRLINMGFEVELAKIKLS